MELDLRYLQYGLLEVNNANEQSNKKVTVNKPYQEVIDYIENNKGHFYFKEFSKKFSNLQGQQNLILSDGTKVLIAKSHDIIKIAIQYPDKTRFIGSWSNIADEKEFYKKCQNIE